ncbi:MAG: SDR family NAD(P)-dependent oxidoreductase [Nitrospiria bacterium]
MPRKKIVLITGASGGLGQALCRTFSTGDYQIGVHVDRNTRKGIKTVQDLNAVGHVAALFSADLRNPLSVRRIFDDLLGKWGRIDLLINNAAVRSDRLLMRMRRTDWDDVIDLNLSGTFFCMREAGRAMCRNGGGGHIINIASYSAYTGRIGQASYTASKRGLIALTQTAAREWGSAAIQVNTVLPGFLSTSMTAGLTSERKEQLIEENLLRHSSTLEEVSEFILHLSKMKHVSGQTFNLDSRIY